MNEMNQCKDKQKKKNYFSVTLKYMINPILRVNSIYSKGGEGAFFNQLWVNNII